MSHRFQVNLRGIIDLLSNHLYSGPEVFVRELLQNGVDAIRARQKIDANHSGSLEFEIHTPRGKPPALIVTDDGVGLTEDEVHRFLATIGESSKRAIEGTMPRDFIGQFGIGILSCFLVCDEIVVISRSVQPGKPAVEWRGRPDGTYDIKTLERDFEPGTQVCLTAKPEYEEYFQVENIVERTTHYGGLLPYPIRVTAGTRSQIINEKGAPWRQEYVSERERTKALLEFGREAFEMSFFDAIPLRAEKGDVDGVAFVLSHEANLAARRTHRVYLKNMLLSENADNLLPEWAFFVKAVVNVNDLRPTASRESFYEDAKLEQARASLGDSLRRYLIDMAEKRPEKLASFLDLHQRAIKALAVQDDAFYRLFIDLLPFETTHGRMPFGEYRRDNHEIRYTATVEQFRQLARVASAQGQCIINAGYSYDQELLLRAQEHFEDLDIEEVEASSLAQSFEDLTLDEQESAHSFMQVAELALRTYKCEPELKKFEPSELPALFSINSEGRFFRSLEQSREIATPLWSGVLDSLGRRERGNTSRSLLCFNFTNPLIQRLTGITNKEVLRRSVLMLYVQSLLLGHHPLNSREMTLLNDGLLELIEWGLQAQG